MNLNGAAAELRPGSLGRWSAALLVVFGLQVLLFTRLERRTPHPVTPPPVAPVFHLPEDSADLLLSVEDPTLLALPHASGFSGQAWLKPPILPFDITEWSRPARLLAMQPSALGGPLLAAPSWAGRPADLPPLLAAPRATLPPPDPAPAGNPSRLRITGDLAPRPLLSVPALPSWTSTDLLTNSVVQLLVNARGETVSAFLLPGAAGPVGADQKKADQLALELAGGLRFQPADAPGGGVASGAAEFEWQTRIVPPSPR
ncbi:MAG: hypothetical protein U1F98_00705 [Verrucomicrobiota bacterium]